MITTKGPALGSDDLRAQWNKSFVLSWKYLRWGVGHSSSLQSFLLITQQCRVIRKAKPSACITPTKYRFCVISSPTNPSLAISSSSNSPTCAVGSINFRLLPIDSESAFWIWAWPKRRWNWLGLSRLLRPFHSSLDGSSFRPLLHACVYSRVDVKSGPQAQ